MERGWPILQGEVTGREAAGYSRLWAAIAERYAARTNPPGAEPLLKGARDGHRAIVVELADYATARACYEDPGSREARRSALRAADRDLVMFAGDLA